MIDDGVDGVDGQIDARGEKRKQNLNEMSNEMKDDDDDAKKERKCQKVKEIFIYFLQKKLRC